MKITRKQIRSIILEAVSESYVMDKMFRFSPQDKHDILVSQIRDVLRGQERRGHSKEDIFKALKEVFSETVQDMQSGLETSREVV